MTEATDIETDALSALPPAGREAFAQARAAGKSPLGALACVAARDLPLKDPVFAEVERADPPARTPPEGFATLVLIAKLTRHCNLRCTYCNDWREGPGQQMTPRTQALMLRRAAEDARAATLKFVWHGGEPSLLGVRRTLGFLWLQAKLRRPGQMVRNSLQTNGVGLTDEIIALWRLFGVRASVSLDGPREMHDRTRRTVAGKPSFDPAADGIARLKAAGLFAGALVVVTEEIAALDPLYLVDALEDAGVDAAAFLPVRPSSADGSGPCLAPEAFARFLVRLLDALRTHPDRQLAVRELDALHAAYQGTGTGFCELRGPCLGDYFGVDPDGQVMHCDKFLGSEAHVLGTLADRSFAEMRASDEMRALKDGYRAAQTRLAGCRWFGRCKGWCPHEAHIADLRGAAGGCCGLAEVFAHFARLEADARREAVHA